MHAVPLLTTAAGLVSDTLTNAIGYTRVGLISAAELAAFKVLLWRDKLDAATPDSALHPSVTQAEALIRWTSVPMFANGNTGTTNGSTPFGGESLHTLLSVIFLIAVQ
jgi:hypothetical protein